MMIYRSIIECHFCGKPWKLCSCYDKTEADPNGIHQNAPGAKLDAGKVDAELVFEGFPRALLAVAEVATFGAKKYTRGGWKEVKDGIQRYDAAHMRHKLKRLKGEEIDPDSKLSHRFHEVWNALAALELELLNKEKSIG